MTTNIIPGMLAKLNEIAVFFVDKVKQKIDDVNAPKAIKGNIFIGSPMALGEGRMYIDVTFDHPTAHAYEYGTDAYRIPNSGEKFMAFPREKWPQYNSSKPAPAYFVFTHVNHPPIQARPYIRPTIIENKEEMRKILGQAFKAEILRGVKKLTVIEVGK